METTVSDEVMWVTEVCAASVTVWTGRTLDSAVMTTRAEMYH
jgi:hypothetical protein